MEFQHKCRYLLLYLFYSIYLTGHTPNLRIQIHL